ncbi:MAG TPA: CPBP family intramembrane glutamic endopeptidase [Kofleriaceae bacterium]
MYHATRAPAVEPLIAMAIVMAAMASYLVVAIVVPRSAALAAAQAALAVVAIVIVAAQHPARPLAALGLRGARPQFFAAAIAIGATAWYVNIQLVSLLPLPEHQARVLAELVDRPPLGYALAMFALLPAVCEEILFRGVLARSLGRRLPIAAGAAISAAVFAGYHLSVVQALPTFTLGFVLGLIAIRADSVAPAIVAHAVNNAAAIAMSRGELPGLAGWLDGHAALALAGCVTATALGIAQVLRGRA